MFVIFSIDLILLNFTLGIISCVYLEIVDKVVRFSDISSKLQT